MSIWKPFNRGNSVGQATPQGDTILRDEERSINARVTIKQGKDYVSVSCVISGWMDHTRFFRDIADAQREYDIMKAELTRIMNHIASSKDELAAWDAISEFVRRYA